MANPVSFGKKHSDAGGYAQVYGTVTASYVRNGNKVTITITVTINSTFLHAHRYGVNVNGVAFVTQDNGLKTATKTYTYDDASAKTYSFPVTTYVQTAAGYSGYTDTYGPLTIAVPAAGAQAYINVGGVAKKVVNCYVNVGGAAKKVNIKVNSGGS